MARQRTRCIVNVTHIWTPLLCLSYSDMKKNAKQNANTQQTHRPCRLFSLSLTTRAHPSNQGISPLSMAFLHILLRAAQIVYQNRSKAQNPGIHFTMSLSISSSSPTSLLAVLTKPREKEGPNDPNSKPFPKRASYSTFGFDLAQRN